jgi:peptide-methionine (S)-S-oxide reductase
MLGAMGSHAARLPTREEALPGRNDAVVVPDSHLVLGHPLRGPWPDHLRTAVFGMGCFWGAERRFWQQSGVYSTAAGYAGGFTPNPTYEEVCSGATGHSEVVLVVYDPARIAYADLLRIFWESHDPTQWMRQGNDHGTQYRSAIYAVNDEDLNVARASQAAYESALKEAGLGAIVTEIARLADFYYAEAYHQQYLARHPNGYCGLRGTGVACTIAAPHQSGQPRK